MTPETIIKILNTRLQMAEQEHNATEIELIKDLLDMANEKNIALTMFGLDTKYIVQAVEKQTPKKLIRHHKKYNRPYQDKYTCPNCGEEPLDGDGCCYAEKYCPECGQALDWGDT